MTGTRTVQTHKEVIIVGGGAAGAAAALALQGTDVLMLDVGMGQTPRSLPDKPLAHFYQSAITGDTAESLDAALIGDSFSSVLQPHETALCIKLKGPEARFAIARPSQIPPEEHASFYSVQSFTKGGLANFWGAGAMRYTSQELQHFPVTQESLDPFFDMLTDHIGISGSSTDDLTDYFGSTHGLLPELELCELGQRFVARYRRWREFCHRRGIFVGRPRLAVLPVHHRGRRPHGAFGQEFFNAPHEGIYSPLFTITELITSGKLEYHGGLVVDTFEQQNDRILIHATGVSSGRPVTYSASKMILAAGAINSSRIVLKTRGDTASRLPLLDNPVSFVPCIDIPRIGVPLGRHSFPGAELNLVFKPSDGNGSMPIQGSLYNVMGPLRTDILKEFPLSFRGNLDAGLYLTPAILMLQLFYPDTPHPDNYLQLLPSGGLRFVREGPLPKGIEGRLASTLRWMGYGAFAFLAKRPIAGSSIHYAGTLPSRENPRGYYETDTLGRLPWADRVHVVDAANFPVLPAKNHTFMLMANAARIGKAVANEIIDSRLTQQAQS